MICINRGVISLDLTIEAVGDGFIDGGVYPGAQWAHKSTVQRNIKSQIVYRIYRCQPKASS